jgi:hypothetical protein
MNGKNERERKTKKAEQMGCCRMIVQEIQITLARRKKRDSREERGEKEKRREWC